MPYLIQRVSAAILLVVLSPILAVATAAVRVRDGAPVIYRGTRYGLRGKRFLQYKIRTMVNDADLLLESHVPGETAMRVTSVGAVLRKTSLDELPQLVNVVRGEMALVGPRPLIDLVFERVDPSHPRFQVLPGITGLAQVSGRNFLPWSERLKLDEQYVQSRSVGADVAILAKTIRVALAQSDIAPDRNPEQVLDI